MSYKTTYVDDDGNSAEVSVTDTESREAIANDYRVLEKKYNPKYVSIERMRAQAGEELHLRITVHAPSHYLNSASDTEPKACSSMSAEVIVYLGYPIKGVSARYPSDHYLASVNVFRSGNACIDTWYPFKSSLISVVEKLVNDMIHNPNVTRYESPANSSMIQWHKDNVAAGHFPTIKPKLLEAVVYTSLPPRGRTIKQGATPPPLPVRRQ